MVAFVTEADDLIRARAAVDRVLGRRPDDGPEHDGDGIRRDRHDYQLDRYGVGLDHERVGLDRVVAITGKPALTGFTAPKVLWVREHEPEAWAARRRG